MEYINSIFKIPYLQVYFRQFYVVYMLETIHRKCNLSINVECALQPQPQYGNRGVFVMPKSASRSRCLSSPLRCTAGSVPCLDHFIKGKLKQLIYVFHDILICFSPADCSYITHHERIHHLPTRAQQRVTQPRWVGKWCGGGY